jgi:hypothetical protein
MYAPRATLRAYVIISASAAVSDAGAAPCAMSCTSSCEKNCVSARPCASEHNVLRSVCAAAKVISSKRRLSMLRLMPACSAAHSPMSSGRHENTRA